VRSDSGPGPSTRPFTRSAIKRSAGRSSRTGMTPPRARCSGVTARRMKSPRASCFSRLTTPRTWPARCCSSTAATPRC